MSIAGWRQAGSAVVRSGGEVWEQTRTSGPYYHVLASYWANGLVHTLSTNTSLPAWTYNPDGEGRVLSVSDSGISLVSSTTYNDYGQPWQPLQVNLGSGDSDKFTFDSSTGRVNQYQAKIGASSATGALTWNANGSLNQLQIADTYNSGNNQTCAYNHDEFGRISKVDCGSGKWGQTFGYDAFGNITKTAFSGQATSFWPGYTASTNQFSCTGCTYDYNGNLTFDGYNNYAWDADGKLSQFQRGTASVYDALGRRVEETNTSGTSEILYGTDGGKFALMSGTTVQKAFIPLPGGATAVYSGSTLGWYRHADWLGTSRIASLPTGSQRVYYDGAASYSPFGEGPTETGNTDHDFTGQNQDVVPNLFYDFPAREYHPGEGRWMSPDPAGLSAVDPTDPQTWNRYAYVRNSPLALVDPLGLVQENSGGVTNGTLTYWSQGCLYLRQVTVVGTTPSGTDGAWIVLGDPEELICPGQMPRQASGPALPGPGQNGSGQGGSRQTGAPNSVSCSTMLPNGQTVGQVVNQMRSQLQSVANGAAQNPNSTNPLGEITGAFYSIARSNGPIDFKNTFKGLASAGALGRAGNFAYYAIGSGILPNWELDAGAGAYALYSAALGRKPFSSLTGPMFSDASAASVRDAALASNGCKP